MNYYVAMTRCFFCLENNIIRLDKQLRDIKELNGKVIDLTPCGECQKRMEEGIIFITIDNELSDENWMKEPIPNPYRTGYVFSLKDEDVKKFVAEEMFEKISKTRWTFIDHSSVVALGIIEKMEDAKNEE